MNLNWFNNILGQELVQDIFQLIYENVDYLIPQPLESLLKIFILVKYLNLGFNGNILLN